MDRVPCHFDILLACHYCHYTSTNCYQKSNIWTEISKIVDFESPISVATTLNGRVAESIAGSG
jgi:hypothetical protein